MYRIRRWSVQHSRFFDWFYRLFDKVLLLVRRLLQCQQLEKPIIYTESRVKGLLFDCQMCGQCILSDTGMSCPMNCPKQMRNGPCGGVRPDGKCEVKPEMACVWVDAWEGSQKIVDPSRIFKKQPPIDHTLQGKSAWINRVS